MANGDNTNKGEKDLSWLRNPPFKGADSMREQSDQGDVFRIANAPIYPILVTLR
jgi:hypothetical protein